MKRKYLQLAIFLMGTTSICCQKNWLDAKPDQSLIIPKNISDYQALLDNTDDIFTLHSPALGELASDYYYVTDQKWAILPTQVEKNSYVWDTDPYKGETVFDWNYPFEQILNTNVILEGIEKVEHNPSNQSAWNAVKGSALFFRAFNYYNLAQVFCKPYQSTSAETDLGLPLRTSPVIKSEVQRSSLKDTYDLIYNDLNNALPLLPDVPAYKNRPSKNAALALLARIALSNEDYPKALDYTNQVLKSANQLLDYNEVDSTAFFIFPQFNQEVIFHSTLQLYISMVYLTGAVDSSFYASFNSDDLRKPLYFKKFRDLYRYWGNYSGAQNPFFNGLSTDEVYLINAEANIRTGKNEQGIQILNKFLEKRLRKETFIPVSFTTTEAIIKRIIEERKKELIGRGLRWSDLRRLNKDQRYSITLSKILNGQKYTLLPNDKRYVFPIPQDEIRKGGLTQN